MPRRHWDCTRVTVYAQMHYTHDVWVFLSAPSSRYIQMKLRVSVCIYGISVLQPALAIGIM